MPQSKEDFERNDAFPWSSLLYTKVAEPCPGLEKKIFREIQQFYTFYTPIFPLGVGY